MHNFGYQEDEHQVTMLEFSIWRRIIVYTRPYAKKIGIAVILSLLISITSLALPYLTKIAIDQYITNQALSFSARLAGLLSIAALFFVVLLIDFAGEFFQVVLLEYTGQHVMHRLRQELFRHLLSLDLPFFDRSPVGRLVTRLTNDIQNMHEMFTSVIVTVFNDFVRIFGIAILLFYMNWKLALMMLLLLPVILGNTVWFSKLARNAFRDIRLQLARLNSFLQETLSGMAILQLFGRQQAAAAKFDQINHEYYLRSMHQILIFGIFMPFIATLGIVAVALIIWYGGGRVLKHHLTLGELAAFLAYMRLFFQPIRELSQKYSIVQSALASAERIFDLLDTKPELLENLKGLSPTRTRGSIEFRDVRFSYKQGRTVLRGLTFNVREGETYAVVGATGSGKTTIINLLERYYDPDAGSIFLDGIDLKELDTGWLRKQIGLVMQDVFIIPATLAENIFLDQPVNSVRLREILKNAQLSELVQQLPDKARTMVGEGGYQLSAGQKQLLSFARVLARDPKILVLDEATSNIDSDTELLVEKAIAHTLSNRTSVVIAHRLSTIRRADRIMVMERGRIVQLGTHEELMQQEGPYRTMQLVQNGFVNHEPQEDRGAEYPTVVMEPRNKWKDEL
jgi:ATP-binding cassette subfamily B multidrug efflux pump